MKLVSWLGNIGRHVFIVMAGILSLLFLDSIREVKKYESLAEIQDETSSHLNPAIQTNKFRAQRNLYISLFAFVFWIVLRRLVDLISDSANLEATSEALKKQAEGASKMAQQLMSDTKDEGDDSTELTAVKEQLENLKTKLSAAVAAEEKAVADLDVMKKQSKATEKEYDRLMGELEKAQSCGDKKDD